MPDRVSVRPPNRTIPLVAWLLLVLAWGVVAGAPAGAAAAARARGAPVSVTAQADGSFAVEAAQYRAVVGADGNLHSFQVGDVEMLDDRIAISLGSFFYADGPRKLDRVTRRRRSMIEATDGTYTARYLLLPDEIRVRLANTGGKPVSYFVVLSPRITIVRNLDGGEAAAAPANEQWGAARFSAPMGAYLELAGGTRIWGPWLGRQVWEVSRLLPGKAREVSFRAGVGDPPKPTLEQLVGVSATVTSEQALASPGEPIAVDVSVDNRSDRTVQSLLSVELTGSRSDMVLYAASAVELPAKQLAQRAFKWRVDVPDFYTARVTVLAAEREVATARAAAGNRPGEIIPRAKRPRDFQQFWRRLRDEVGEHPPHFRMALDRKRSRPPVDVWVLQFEGIAGKIIHGWYVVPQAGRRVPGILYLSGYGARPIAPPLALARQGYAVLAIDVRGNAVDRIRARPFEDYCTEGIESPETYAYREIVGHALRAVNFLREREEADPERIAVVGVSEGGGVGLLLAGLSPSVKAVAAAAPLLCDFPLSLRSAGWPYTEIAHYMGQSRRRTALVSKTLSYFDAVNFAPDIRCPVLLSVGFLDPVSLPAAVYGLHNILPGPKEIRGYPEAGHEGGGDDLWTHKLRWLKRTLEVPEIR